ncbi:MAG: glutamyl-tRNA reductase [Desulfatibacillaceae bacterium]
MDIVLVGLNHRTAPVEMRECLAYSEDRTRASLEKLHGVEGVDEAVLVSTCNRTEVLAAVRDPDDAVSGIKRFLAEDNNLPVAELENHLYAHMGDEAVRHVFRVAASLDSMVLGEPQILGQIKDSYRTATETSSSGTVLNRLMHKSFSVAKRVRRETGIGGHAVSISYAAVELARKIFDALAGRKVLLIGAGEMAELAVEHLLRNHVSGIYVANRTFERGVDLAMRFGGRAVRFSEIPEYLKEVDIIISSTGAPGFVITRDDVKGVLRARKNRPLFFIDIALPRDVDPAANRLSNVYVYDIDDLNGVIDQNIRERRKEAIRAESIVDEGVVKFRKWFSELDVVPTIVSLKEKARAVREAETARTLRQLENLSEEDRAAIDRLTESIVNKLLHDPIQYLKDGGMDEHAKRSHLDAVRRIFGLEEPEE